jgi:hypothetical protein
MRITPLLLILFLGPALAYSAIHYASPDGSSTWASATNIGTPCSIKTAFASAVAGDLVYFRGGTYSSASGDPGGDLESVFAPAHAGTGDTDAQRIIFQAYPGEIPIIEHTWTDSTIVHHVFGTNNYVTYDGFTLKATGGDSAGLHIGGPEDGEHHVGVIVKNMTIIGGANNAPAIANNRDLVRFENADYCKIQKCKIGPFKTDGVTDNGSLIKIYHVIGATIEGNDLFNSSSMGISVKGYLTGADIRYNWFHGNAQSFRINTYSGVNSFNVKIYHNIFYQTSAYQITNFNAESGSTDTGWEVYNNTMLSSRATVNFAEAAGTVTGFKLYNNILKGGSGYDNMFVPSYGVHTFSEADHNQWGNNSFRIYWKGKTYTTLSWHLWR